MVMPCATVASTRWIGARYRNWLSLAGDHMRSAARITTVRKYCTRLRVRLRLFDLEHLRPAPLPVAMLPPCQLHRLQPLVDGQIHLSDLVELGRQRLRTLHAVLPMKNHASFLLIVDVLLSSSSRSLTSIS